MNRFDIPRQDRIFLDELSLEWIRGGILQDMYHAHGLLASFRNVIKVPFPVEFVQTGPGNIVGVLRLIDYLFASGFQAADAGRAPDGDVRIGGLGIVIRPILVDEAGGGTAGHYRVDEREFIHDVALLGRWLSATRKEQQDDY